MGKNKFNNMSNEELLQLLKDFAKELGHSPSTIDVKENDKLPSAKTYCRRFNVKSWNDILRIALLKERKQQFLTKQDGINQLIILKQKLNRIPTKHDIEEIHTDLNYDWYIKIFKSLENALIKAGLIAINKSENLNMGINKQTEILINELVKDNLNIEFKKCSKCERELPKHKIFFSKNKSSNDGFSHICTECNSILHYNGEYKFVNSIQMKWYDGKEDEFKILFRTMTKEELAEYYKVDKNEIRKLIRRLDLKVNECVDNYSDDEIIKIYDSILKGYRNRFPNGFENIYRYKIIILKYLINDKLKWNRTDICNKLSFIEIFKEYKLSAFYTTTDSYLLLCDTFPNYDIKRWELLNSSASNNFWNEKNSLLALNWFKTKLKENKNIYTIYEASKYGFINLIDEYNLSGLCQSKYKSAIQMFEEMFNTIYINMDCNRIGNKNEGIIYEIKDSYYNLDEKHKQLINYIINFCETQERFPYQADLCNNNGYMSITVFKQYFGEKPYSNLFKYIKPLDRVLQNYWNDKENREYEVKNYCEKICNENILSSIHDTYKLQKWIKKYFNQEQVQQNLFYFQNIDSDNNILYKLLTEAYPIIKNNNILFDWEWNISLNIEKDYLIKSLREFVIYRMNELLDNDIENNLPKMLNRVVIAQLYPRFNCHLNRKRFANYYEWACLSFPEYSTIWTPKDFGLCVAYDGTQCSSQEEVIVYEYIKQILKIPYIKSIGKQRSGKYTYSLNNSYEQTRFCPDFVIEHLNINGIKTKLEKPLIIEYYGWYYPNNNNFLYKNYVDKTHEKNRFYCNNKDIDFIAIYPNDIKRRLKGLDGKIKDYINKLNKKVA